MDSLKSHPLTIVSGKAAMPCKALPDTLPARSKEITQAWYWTVSTEDVSTDLEVDDVVEVWSILP